MSREPGLDPSTPILGTLASHEIVVDRPQSHNHLAHEMGLDLAGRILERVLHQIDARDQDYLITETPSDEPSLRTPCVTTGEHDEIVYAYRHLRVGQTRFVVDREPEPTDRVTTVLRRDQDHPGIMVLIAAMAGPKAEPEPWDPGLTDEQSRVASRLFWAAHALIWEPETVDFTRSFGEEPDEATARALLG